MAGTLVLTGLSWYLPFWTLVPTQYILFCYRKNNLGLRQKQWNNSETGDFFSYLWLDQIFVRCRFVGTFLRWEVCGITNASSQCIWQSLKSGSPGLDLHVKQLSVPLPSNPFSPILTPGAWHLMWHPWQWMERQTYLSSFIVFPVSPSVNF